MAETSLNNHSEETWVTRLRNESQPLVIFGAGAAGETLVHACRENGFEVVAICDNNIEKAGRMVAGVEVVHSGAIKTLLDEAFVIISAADIMDIARQMENLGYSWMAGAQILEHYDFSALDLPYTYEFIEFAVTTCIMCQNGYLDPEKIFLRSVDIIVTEKCTLKCKDCSNLMQYYQAPQNCDADEVITAIHELLSVVDGVNEFRVIGGEPFVNKDIWKINNAIVAEPKVRRNVIYTNGTILPKGKVLDSLKNDKTMLIITDYAELSRNSEKLVATLKAENIDYYIAPAQNWTDCASIRPHNRTVEEQTAVFDKCCAKNLFTLSDNRFYRCPFAANVDRLGATPHFPGDYVDVSGAADNPNDTARALNEYISDKPYLEVCDYCDGRYLEDEKIVPGVQVKQPIPYEVIQSAR